MILNFNIDRIEQIYYGADNHCRCGCGGNYALPNTSQFYKYLEAIEDLGVEDYIKVESSSEPFGHINISLPGNKAYTIYLKE